MIHFNLSRSMIAVNQNHWFIHLIVNLHVDSGRKGNVLPFFLADFKITNLAILLSICCKWRRFNLKYVKKRIIFRFNFIHFVINLFENHEIDFDAALI